MVRYESEFIAKRGNKIEVILKLFLNEYSPKVYSLGVFRSQQEALDLIEEIKPLIEADLQDPSDFPQHRAERFIDQKAIERA